MFLTDVIPGHTYTMGAAQFTVVSVRTGSGLAAVEATMADGTETMFHRAALTTVSEVK